VGSWVSFFLCAQVGSFSGQAAPAAPGGAGAGANSGAGSLVDITARLRVAQQRRNAAEVLASIPTNAPEPAARAFTALLADLEAALKASS
jgi:hypothetical protein